MARERITKKELDLLLDQIIDSITVDKEKLQHFLDSWNSQGGVFHRYTFQNWAYAYWQNRNISLLAGYHTWEKIERHVVKGEHAIKVWAPYIIQKKEEGDDGGEKKTTALVGFFGVPVFDVSQTDGEPIEEILKDRDIVNYVKGDIDFDELKAKCPYDVQVRYENTRAAGHTDGNTITVEACNSAAFKASVLFHEWAHCILEHHKAYAENKESAEIEAEAAAGIACQALGLTDEFTGPYLATWNATKEKVVGHAGRILKAAQIILDTIEGRTEDETKEKTAA